MAKAVTGTVDRQTFCIYCQEDFKNDIDLGHHIVEKHKRTYAYYRVICFDGKPFEKA